MAQSAQSDAPTTAVKPEASTEDLARQIELLKADISRLTETMGTYGRTKGREYAGEARRRASELRAQADDRAAALRDRAESKVDEIEQYVRENPATALGIAAGIGFLVGLLNRR